MPAANASTTSASTSASVPFPQVTQWRRPTSRDVLRAVGHDVEHAARVEREHLHGAVGLVVERGGGVRRQGGDVGRAIGIGHVEAHLVESFLGGAFA